MDSDEGTLSVPVDDWDQLLEERHRLDDGALEDRLTAELAELGDRYLEAPTDQREAVRRAFDGRAALLDALLGQVHRAASRLRAAGETAWLLRGLTSASIEDRRTDSRDLVLALGELWLAAARAGLDPGPHFRRVGALSGQVERRGTSTSELLSVFDQSAHFRAAVAPQLAARATRSWTPVTPRPISPANAGGAAHLADLAARSGTTSITGLAWSPDGRTLGATDWNRVLLYDAGGVPEPRVQLRAELFRGRGLAFSPDGALVAIGGAVSVGDAAGIVHVWDVASGTTRAAGEHHSGPVAVVAFDPRGATLASAGRDRLVRLWRVGGDAAPTSLVGHRLPVSRLAFSPDGGSLASCGAGKVVIVWDLERRDVRARLEGHGSSVTDIAFHPRDPTVLASSSRDGSLRLWDLARGGVTRQLDGEHGRGVRALAFTPDGAVLACCGDDRRLRLWHGTTLAPLAAFDESVFGFDPRAWDPTGSLRAAAGTGGVVRIYGLPEPRRGGRATE